MYSAEDHADASAAIAKLAEDRSSDLSDLELAHDHMHIASELINGVMERNRIGTPLQAISFLSEAKRDADLGERAIEMGERYLGWDQDGAA